MSESLMHSSTRPTARADSPTRNYVVWLGFVLAVIALGLLSVAARSTPYFPIDLTIARAVQGIPAPWFHTLIDAFSYPGYPPQVYVLVVLALAIFLILRQWWNAISFAFATFGVSALGMAVKLWVSRPRPSPDLIHVVNANLQGGGLSFPAGHAQTYVTILGFLMFLILQAPHRQGWQTLLLLVFGLMIALIGVSRIDMGEHWFSDVVAGYLLGAIGLWLTILFYRWHRLRDWIEHRKHSVAAEERK